MRSVLDRVQILWLPSHLVRAGILTILVFLLVPSDLGLKTRLLAGWTVGVGSFLLLLILMMKKATAEQTHARAQHHQASSTLILALVSTVALISLFAVGFLISTAKEMPPLIQILHVSLSALAILVAWVLTHTTFAQQYAVLYYRPALNNTDYPWAGGLLFQKQGTPNYSDFLYFAFVIGATAQTSDTLILSQPIRRLVLVQALVSFLFFVGILAMCVNIGSALLESRSG
jgi:uncharacterized membrane protein